MVLYVGSIDRKLVKPLTVLKAKYANSHQKMWEDLVDLG